MTYVHARLAMAKGRFAVVAFEKRDTEGNLIHTAYAVFCGTSYVASFGSLKDAVLCLEEQLSQATASEKALKFVVMDEDGNERYYAGLQQARKDFEARLADLKLDRHPSFSAEISIFEQALADSRFFSWLVQFEEGADARKRLGEYPGESPHFN